MRLKDKVAIVTGSSQGIGRYLLTGLAKEGTKSVICDINDIAFDDVAKELEALGGESIGVKTDVAKKADVENMVEKTLSKFGKIDILVNNAGGSFGQPRRIEDITEEQWDLVNNVNLKGTFLCCQAAIPSMKKQGGAIVNMSSAAARVMVSPIRMLPKGGVNNVAYSASKGGVIGFTRALAYELGPFNIRVNAIAPGRILSLPANLGKWEKYPEAERKAWQEEVPLRRPGYESDILGVTMFLVTDESAYVTGRIIDVDGGSF